MQGKYNSWPQFILAKINRWFLRLKISSLITWKQVQSNELEDGCTALLGMCSRLPEVLEANLRCLYTQRWSDLKSVFIIVDNKQGCLSDDFQQKIINLFPELNIQFFYYNEKQYQVSQQLQLPYVFCWLSWCIGLSKVNTKTILLHDYDALILSKHLSDRYQKFIKTQVKVQGIKCYKTNGFSRQDLLATTFEAFVDTAWVRSFTPIKLFNHVGLYKNRKVDYDILLYLQAQQIEPSQKDVTPVEPQDLVHPTQMIHQYTMFQKCPNKPLPCYSIIMIPLFAFLSGNQQAFRNSINSIEAIDRDNSKAVNFLSDGSQINFSKLKTVDVDWALKQILEAFLSLEIEPFTDFIEYGNSLYLLCKTPNEKLWIGDFTPSQKQWIQSAQSL